MKLFWMAGRLGVNLGPKTLKYVSLLPISQPTRKGDLLIKKQGAGKKQFWASLLVLAVVRQLHCSGISSVGAGRLELLIPSQKCSG